MNLLVGRSAAGYMALAICGLTISACSRRPESVRGEQQGSAGSSHPSNSAETESQVQIESATASPPSQDEPTATNPVVATASFERSAICPGEAVDILVIVRVAPGWHISALDNYGSVSEPTTLELELPPELKTDGKWSAPEPELDSSSAGPASRIYRGAVTFQRRIRASLDAAAGKHEIRCRIGYQACDRFSCHAFTTLNVRQSVVISAAANKE